MANFQITSTDKWKRSAVIADRGKIARGKESANRNEPKLQKEYSNSVGRPDNRSAVVRTASAHFARFIFSFLHLFRSFAACHFSSFRFTSFRFISVHFHFMSYSCVHSFIISFYHFIMFMSMSISFQCHFTFMSMSCPFHFSFISSHSFKFIPNAFQDIYFIHPDFMFISWSFFSSSSSCPFSYPCQFHSIPLFISCTFHLLFVIISSSFIPFHFMVISLHFIQSFAHPFIACLHFNLFLHRKSLCINDMNESINRSINQSINETISRSSSQTMHHSSVNQPSINRQSIHRSINETIKRSFNQSINQSIHQSINQSTSQSVYQSINQSIKSNQIKSINQSMKQSIKQ